MKKILPLFLLVFAIQHSTAQSWLWGVQAIGNPQNPNELSPKVTTDKYGNAYLACGFEDTIRFGPYTITDNPPFVNMYLVKYNSSGAIKWVSHPVFSKNAESSVYGIATDTSGNVYITGYFKDTLYFGPYMLHCPFNVDAFIVKYDSLGNVVWAHQSVAAAANSVSVGNSIALDGAGNAYITGNFYDSVIFGPYSLSMPSYNLYDQADVFLVKYDVNGNVLWARQSKNNSVYCFGTGNAVTTDKTGNVYITGNYADSVLFGTILLTGFGWRNGLFENIYLAKYDGNGNVLWARQSVCKNKSLLSAGFSMSNSVVIDNADNPYISGFYGDTIAFGSYTLSSLYAENLFLTKYDTAGNLRWVKQALPNCGSIGKSLSADKHNNIYLAAIGGAHITGFGNFVDSIITDYYSISFLLKLDTSGTVLCGSSFLYQSVDASQVGVSISADANGQYLYEAAGIYNDTLIFGQDTLRNSYWAVPYVAKWQPCCSSTVPSNNLTICQDSTLILIASGGSSYNWNTGAKTSAISVTPQITTNYQAIIKRGACIIDSNIHVNVKMDPTTNIHVSANPICNGDSILLIATETGAYQWSIGATKDTITIKPATNFTVSLKITSNGCYADTSIVIIVNPLPVANITGDTSICRGERSTLTASGGSSYIWNTGATTSSITVTPATYKNYVVSVSNGPCAVKDSLPIYVYPIPVPSISPKQNICLGSYVTLTVSGGTIYSWNNGDTTATVNVNPIADTLYSVKVSNGHCSARDSVEVMVYPYPTPSISNTQIICNGASADLTISGGTTYIWSNGNTKSDISVNPLSETTYSVTLYNGPCPAWDSVKVIVNPRPDILLCCDSIINASQNVYLTANGGSTYSWMPTDGLSCADCPNPIAAPTQNITYTVTAISDSGCQSSKTLSIEVSCNIFIPDVFSPNGDGQNDILYVRCTCIKSMDFLIFDRWGNKVFESENVSSGWNGEYKGQPMNSGTYVYYLTTTLYDGSTVEKKGNVALVR